MFSPHHLPLLRFVLPIFNSHFLRVCFIPTSHERHPFGFFPIHLRSATVFTCQVSRFSYHTRSHYWTLYPFIKDIILGTPVVSHWISHYSRLLRHHPSLSSYKMAYWPYCSLIVDSPWYAIAWRLNIRNIFVLYCQFNRLIKQAQKVTNDLS